MDSNIKDISSQELLGEIKRRFEERESTIKETQQMLCKMEEMNKLLLTAQEDRSKFISIIRNEFNNPMGTLVSMSNALLKKADEPLEVVSIGESIQEEVLSLNFQIQNIIYASEIESGTLDIQVAKIDLNDMLNSIKEKLKYTIKHKKIDFIEKLSYEDDLYLDKEKVELVLLNLISNAIEFSPVESKVEIDILEGINNCKIVIKDYGEGIEADEKEKIFHRFYQTNNSKNRPHRGHGLGLSIVKEIVEFMDGVIAVDSKTDHYTIFEISLPSKDCEEAIFDDDDFMFSDSSCEF